jgi:hypothetical protein
VHEWRSDPHPVPAVQAGPHRFDAVAAGPYGFRAVGSGSYGLRAVEAGSYGLRAVEAGSHRFRAVGPGSGPVLLGPGTDRHRLGAVRRTRADPLRRLATGRCRRQAPVGRSNRRGTVAGEIPATVP